MTEVDTGEALNQRIDAAKLAGDMVEANRLYRQQQGTTDPFGLEALSDAGGEADDAVAADISAA